MSLTDSAAASRQPAQVWPPELLLRAQGVRVAIFDVDGVLTDGGLYYDAQGESLKRFSTLDGLGLKLLRRAQIEPVVISGRDSPALRARLAALAVTHAALGSEDKLPAAEKMLASLQADWPQTAVIGDDWPDLPLFARAAFTCAPANAHPEVRARAHHVTAACGGEGAARAFCDLLLTAAGRYRALLDAYTAGAPTPEAAP
ncbi:MAG: HAD hydrolase family protein [Burkholderiaceae bacterium]|jgi:3-deoxy-D-manno-octulosonate 8-phosphate phosphatase (KDO 8-P phosphatase)|nr:HAD hydrolase family protein [Burkholderiaceae bacterium]